MTTGFHRIYILGELVAYKIYVLEFLQFLNDNFADPTFNLNYGFEETSFPHINAIVKHDAVLRIEIHIKSQVVEASQALCNTQKVKPLRAFFFMVEPVLIASMPRI